MTLDMIEQVAVASGKILHEGTGKPIDGSISVDADECAIVGHFLEDGNFAVSTWPAIEFPDLATQAYLLTLAISVESKQFVEGSYEETRVVPIPMGSTFEPPIDLGLIQLPADPVDIGGRVFKARDPDTPIANATVKLVQGASVTATEVTDADGRYRFNQVPVLAGAKLECSAATFRTVERPLLIDFRQLLHEEYVRLPPT